jgi:hypothetical protein
MGRNSQSGTDNKDAVRCPARGDSVSSATTTQGSGAWVSRSVSPAPETLKRSSLLQIRMPNAGGRKSAVAVPRPSPGARQQPKWSRSPICNLPPGSQGNSFPPAGSRTQEPRNGRFNSSRFRISRAPRFRSSLGLSSPSLVTLVPLRLPPQPPLRPQQARRLRRRRRNHGLWSER